MLAIKKISKYFPDLPAEEHIHVLVEPPVSTAASNREQELLDRIAALESSLNKSVYGTYFAKKFGPGPPAEIFRS